MKIVIYLDDKTTRTYYVSEEVATAIDILLKQNCPTLDIKYKAESEK